MIHTVTCLFTSVKLRDDSDVKRVTKREICMVQCAKRSLKVGYTRMI